MSTKETMVHPFTGIPCDVTHLNPGDVVESGDVYRSVTVTEGKSDMGRWFAAGDVVAGTTVGPTCNVHFLRLSPSLESESGLTEAQEEELLSRGLHAVE